MKSKSHPTEFDLLEIYVEEMEQLGESRKFVRLSIDDSMAARIGSKFGSEVTLKQVQGLADRCLANEWLEYTGIGTGKYGNLIITTSGFGVVRSRQRHQEILEARSFPKKVSDYIEDHKGLFVVLGVAIALAGLLVKLFGGY